MRPAIARRATYAVRKNVVPFSFWSWTPLMALSPVVFLLAAVLLNPRSLAEIARGTAGYSSTMVVLLVRSAVLLTGIGLGHSLEPVSPALATSGHAVADAELEHHNSAGGERRSDS